MEVESECHVLANYRVYRTLGGAKGQTGRVRKISPTPDFDSRTVQPVVCRYTDWAIPALHDRPSADTKQQTEL
jgi:hypothetical protein